MRFDFDRESAFEAGEVGDVAVTRKLTTESESVRPFAQLLPKDDFRQGEVATELACAAKVLIRRADGAMPDTPIGPSPS